MVCEASDTVDLAGKIVIIFVSELFQTDGYSAGRFQLEAGRSVSDVVPNSLPCILHDIDDF